MVIEELYDLLQEDKPSNDLRKYESELFALIPELEVCKGFEQNSDWHIYDVYEHILHVVDNVSSDLVLRLAALFHDIGKPFSYTEDENGIGHFYGHWVVSKKIFDLFSDKYGIDENISNRVSDLILYHDLDIFSLNESDLDKFLQKFDENSIMQLYELKKADLLAQNEKYYYILDRYEVQKKKILIRVENKTR